METLTKKTLNLPLNRAEGDLEIRVDLEDGCVSDAWSAGVMFRGIENLMKGRGALDGLVVTPRICGICGTAHLTAAAKALDIISGIEPPPGAKIVRNLALMTEHLQSDMRQGFLFFMADFVNPAYGEKHFYEEAVRRYEPFKGETVVQVIQNTKEILEIVAILGGQWPHSSYMVPGGIATMPGRSDFLQCRYLLERYLRWYEKRVLGCPVERWREVESVHDLEVWLEESASHRYSDLGFYLRYGPEIGLDRIGGGHGNFISFDQFDLPAGTTVRGRMGDARVLVPGGLARGVQVEAVDEARLEEHVSHAWYESTGAPRHPFESTTEPYATGRESGKYSWVKAPRYDGLPAETGPLAEMITSGHPLFIDLVETNGPSAFVRQLARFARPAELMPVMKTWLDEIDPGERFYTSRQSIESGRGAGLTAGSRGALGHWVKIENGRIAHYQIITPTAWNGSPRDDAGIRGPWEEALVGTPVEDGDNPVELGHVIRSFDPCLVCAVHTVRGKVRV
jgi:hydrogenase large subunit